MNLSLGIGGMLAFAAGVIFVLIMVMTVVKGRKVSTIEQAIAGLEAPALARKVTYNRTPLALIPPASFIVAIIVLTVIAFNILWGIPSLK